MIVDRLLRIPAVYSRFWALFGGHGPAEYMRTYARPSSADQILDIGCGTADILDYLPAGVRYVGLDADADYIARARTRYGTRGDFLCARLDRSLVARFTGFNLVLASGVVHHLDDGAAADLFALARAAVTPRGRLVTIDPCFVAGQSVVARFLLNRDRGKFVRTDAEYQRLARAAFPEVSTSIRHDLVRMPYTHLIMECRL